MDSVKVFIFVTNRDSTRICTVDMLQSLWIPSKIYQERSTHDEHPKHKIIHRKHHASDATPVHHSTTTPELYSLSPDQHLQGAVQSLLAVTLAIDEVSAKRSQTGGETHRQTATKLFLDLVHLLNHLAVAAATESACVAAGRHDGVHGGAEEQADSFIDVLLCRNGRELEFGERF
jgi:hypothetical protein